MLPPWEELYPHTFLDHIGDPVPIFLQHDLPYRDGFAQMIRVTGGIPCSWPPDFGFLVVDPTMESSRDIIEKYGGTRDQMVVSVDWLDKSLNAGYPVIGENWGGCRLRPLGWAPSLPSLPSLPSSPSSPAASPTALPVVLTESQEMMFPYTEEDNLALLEFEEQSKAIAILALAEFAAARTPVRSVDAWQCRCKSTPYLEWKKKEGHGAVTANHQG